MEKMNVVLATQTKEIADYKTYIEVVNRVCYYDEPNGNGVLLPYNDDALTIAQTLVDMPVQAKYVVNAKGEPDLLDHCMSIDENGEVMFNTESIGTHTEVWIEDDTVETFKGEIKTLPCLFAKQKIWKRYNHYVSLITKLYKEGNLHNSWEISSFEYLYENGIKKLLSYVFEGNAYLGSTVTPAYGNSAKALELSKLETVDLMVASALAKDMSTLDTNTSRKEGAPMTKNTEEKIAKQEEISEDGVIDEMIADTEKDKEKGTKTKQTKSNPQEDTTEVVEYVAHDETNEKKKKIEISALTADDIAFKVARLYEQQSETYVYCYAHFSEEKTVWLRAGNRNSELEVIVVHYEVSDNDEVSIIGEPVITLLVTEISNVYTKYSEMSEELSKAQSTITELSQYKDKYNEMQSEIEQAELQETKSRLIEMVEKADCLTKEEKYSEEVSSLIENCDEEGLTKYIGNKYICSSMSNTKAPKKKEVSSVRTNVRASLFNDKELSTKEEEIHSKAEDFRNSFLFN